MPRNDDAPQSARRFVTTLLYWAALVAVLYGGSLGIWQWTEPFYLRALERGVAVLQSVGVLPQALQAVAVPDHGLAVIGTGVKPLAVPQRILGADLALTAALILGSTWLPLRDRMLRGGAGLGLVFAAHLATIVAQTWVNMSASPNVWTTWNLWTTLYQGKVVPITIWALFIGLPLVHGMGTTSAPRALAARRT